MIWTILGRRLAVPSLPTHHVERTDLLQRLDPPDVAAPRISVVAAAAGSGKTTLLASLVARVRIPAGWFGLGEMDADAAVLYGHLEACLGRMVPGLLGSARARREIHDAEDWEQVVAVLCDDLAMAHEEPLLLVLDQLERIERHASSQRIVRSLVGNLPDNIRLVLAGRTLPVDLARERLAGHVLDLGKADLAMTPLEVARLLASTGQSADARQATGIVAATGGWAAGAAWMAVPRPAARASGLLPGSGEDEHALDAYLVQEVLAPLDTPVRELLLRTAPLQVLDAESVRTLAGTSWEEARRALARLESFGRVGRDEIEWQSFFREFLVRRLSREQPKAEQSTIWRRVALLVAAEPEQAIRCLLRAEDIAGAEDLLVASLGQLLAEGKRETVLETLTLFPPEVRGKSAAWLHARGECSRESGACVEACEILEQALGACPSQETELALRISAGLAAAWGARGRIEALKVHALKAIHAEDAGSRGLARNALGLAALQELELDSALEHFAGALADFRMAGRPAGEMRILHNRGLVHARSGHLERAVAAYGEAIRQAEAHALSPFPLTFNNLALCHLHMGRLEEAWQTLEQGMAVANRSGTPRDRMLLLRTRGQLLAAGGDGRAAAEAYDESLDIAARLGDTGATALGHLGLAEAALGLANLPKARASLEQAVESAGQPLAAASMTEAAAVAARIALAEGQPDRALEHCHVILGHLERTTNDLQLFRTLELLEAAHAGRGEALQAEAALARARTLADKHGYPLRPRGAAMPESPPPPLPPNLEMDTCGSFEVRIEGTPLRVREWRTSNAKLVLAYLLMHPQGATKERLHDLLYPGSEPARSALAMVISRLRQILEPEAPKGSQSRFIHFHDGRYVFARGLRARLDVNGLRALLDQAGRPETPPTDRSRLRREALAHYRGPFLEEFPDHPWCQVEREGLRRLAVRAWETTFAEAGEAGDWPDLERLATACLEADPTSQGAIRARMIALCMQERAQDALRSTAASLQVLRAEHGLDADEDTDDLVAQVKEGRFTVRLALEYLSRQT
ncbi:MAG: BTAD domain-containing putative transcriptional regulator [Candidatus Sericytochromatia bacterium]|nr:BTAD domain-containing putative transcriptional regulator [Candidatus Sericytochromatia bacterium]